MERINVTISIFADRQGSTDDDAELQQTTTCTSSNQYLQIQS